jgi:hypothetical protein
MAVDTAAAPLLTLDEAAAMLLCPDTQGPAGRHRRWRCGRVSVTFWRMGNGVARVVRHFGFSTPFQAIAILPEIKTGARWAGVWESFDSQHRVRSGGAA